MKIKGFLFMIQLVEGCYNQIEQILIGIPNARVNPKRKTAMGKTHLTTELTKGSFTWPKTTQVSKIARSMTSSSSPLVGEESETETLLSSTESDEAYGSGHISSVSEVKPIRSATKKSVSHQDKSIWPVWICNQYVSWTFIVGFNSSSISIIPFPRGPRENTEQKIV